MNQRPTDNGQKDAQLSLLSTKVLKVSPFKHAFWWLPKEETVLWWEHQTCKLSKLGKHVDLTLYISLCNDF